MNRILAITTLILFSMLGVTACAAEPDTAQPSAPAVLEEPANSDSEETDKPAEAEAVMPEDARPGSADFPFPVPKDWTELEPFVEEKIGKDIGMFVMLEYPGDAESASETYQRLLEEAGYAIHPNPLGEQVHAASFVVKGGVAGVDYSGTIDFDTDAVGTQRVLVNLTQD